MQLHTYNVLDGHITVEINPDNTIKVHAIAFDHDQCTIKDTRVIADFCRQVKNFWPVQVPQKFKSCFNPIPEKAWCLL